MCLERDDVVAFAPRHPEALVAIGMLKVVFALQGLQDHAVLAGRLLKQPPAGLFTVGIYHVHLELDLDVDDDCDDARIRRPDSPIVLETGILG